MYEITRICNKAPNGIDIDIFQIMQVPNADNSRVEYAVDYQSFDFMKRFLIGNVSLVTGNISFVHTNDGLGVSCEGLKLLADWIEKNKEPD